MIITCPLTDCVYNGFGECQLGSVANALEVGIASEQFCPYYDPNGRDEAPGDHPQAQPGEQLLG